MALTGSISQRSDGRWKVKYKDIETTCKTKTDATRKLKELRSKERRVSADISQKTMSDIVEDWLEYKKSCLKPSSYDRIEQSWNNHVKKYVGSIQVGALQEQDIERMLSKMSEKGYKYTTVKKAYEVLSSCFRYYEERKQIFHNPTTVVKVPAVNKKPRGEIACYTEEELKRIYRVALSRCKSDSSKYVYRNGWAIILLGNTGMRASELFGLKKKNIDLDNRILYVRGNCVIAKDRTSKAKKTRVVEQNTPKTESSIRAIPLNDLAIQAVKELWNRNPKSEYLLETRNGNLALPSNIDRSFRRILKAAGIPDDRIYGVHALRHSFATNLIRRGVNPKVVASLLGHENISITLQTYTHAFGQDLIDAVNELKTVNI